MFKVNKNYIKNVFISIFHGQTFIMHVKEEVQLKTVFIMKKQNYFLYTNESVGKVNTLLLFLLIIVILGY